MLITVILGSNSGDKKHYLHEAARLLSEKAGKITAASSLYETAPWGFTCQENFLNQVLVFETELNPQTFLQTALQTEQILGRKRDASVRYSSRTIDIDLLFCGSQIIHTPELTLPHPRIAERNFVLTPLNELMPDFIHPILHKTVSQLLSVCPDPLTVKRL